MRYVGYLNFCWGEGHILYENIYHSLMASGLHGSVNSYHVTAVFELRDVPVGDGGFGALVGSHKSSYVLPSHEGWRLPPWPATIPVQGVDMKAGDVLVFSEKWACFQCARVLHCPIQVAPC